MTNLIPSYILVLLDSSEPRRTDQQYCVDCWALLSCANTSRSYIFGKFPTFQRENWGTMEAYQARYPISFPAVLCLFSYTMWGMHTCGLILSSVEYTVKFWLQKTMEILLFQVPDQRKSHPIRIPVLLGDKN